MRIGALKQSYADDQALFDTPVQRVWLMLGALALGLDAGLETDQRLFFYLPFEHSEDLDDQHTSVRLITALGNADYLDFAKKHCAIIEQFGRFPHRNAVLGRANRPGEEQALRQGAGW